MCGICGLYSSTGDRESLAPIAEMTRRAAHRGPDARGTVLFGRHDATDAAPTIAFGHTRLAIIDLSDAGRQPMSDPSGRNWIVLNGEVYNYRELRSDLERGGTAFRTHTDTEVVLKAYQRWGLGALARFNGMWAFAIGDDETGELFLARDRFGVKPLYYVARPGLFAFASELKQLVGTVVLRPRLNRRATADFLLWSLQDHLDETFFEEVRPLPAGCYLRLKRAEVVRGEVTPQRYWVPTPEFVEHAGDVPRTFAGLFEDAVRLRLRSDVPVGVTLSGGIDSSSIACVAGRLRREADEAEGLRAFTAVYDGAGQSEEHFANAVVKAAGLSAGLIRPTAPQLADDWSTFVRCMEEPFATLSFYSSWKVYEQIRRSGVPVVLNGQGGDELLLGYERYRVPLVRLLLGEWRLGRAFREVWLGRSRAGMGLARMLLFGLYFGVPSLRVARRTRMLRPYAGEELLEMLPERRGVVREDLAWPDLAGGMIQQFARFQLPHLLRHEDRVSMHHAVEARSPFLDYRLFNLILGSGRDWLIRDGWSKAVLREAMRGIVPEEVRTRTDKMGYETPTGRLIGHSAGFFDDLLARNVGDPMLKVAAIRRGLHQGGVDESVLCSALSYLAWKEEFGVAA